MMAFRIAFDLDGVLADMSVALTREERRLIGVQNSLLRPSRIGSTEAETDQDEGLATNPVVAEMQSHGLTVFQQKVLWQRIAETPNFLNAGRDRVKSALRPAALT